MLGERAKAVRSRRRKPRSSVALAKRLARRCQDLRGQLLELGQEGARVQHEDAAVPEVARRRRRRLPRWRGSASRRRHRPHSRRRQPASGRRAGCSRSRCAGRSARCRTARACRLPPPAAARFRLSTKAGSSFTTWSDGMTAITASADFCGGQQRRDGDRRRGVAGDRLEDDRLGLHGRARELLAHQEAVVVVADDDRARRSRRRRPGAGWRRAGCPGR